MEARCGAARGAVAGNERTTIVAWSSMNATLRWREAIVVLIGPLDPVERGNGLLQLGNDRKQPRSFGVQPLDFECQFLSRLPSLLVKLLAEVLAYSFHHFSHADRKAGVEPCVPKADLLLNLSLPWVGGTRQNTRDFRRLYF
jgi:hypothetical protein